MKALGALLLLELLDRAWCCSPEPGDTNIAGGGEALQSSTFSNSPAYKAIDGVKNTDWFQGYCSHTNKEWEPWWRLDMKQRYKVHVVVLALRGDSYLERNQGIELRIGDSPDVNNPVCGKTIDAKYYVVTFMCYGMVGQYIHVVIPGRTDYLTLCEAEVYGDLVI